MLGVGFVAGVHCVSVPGDCSTFRKGKNTVPGIHGILFQMVCMVLPSIASMLIEGFAMVYGGGWADRREAGMGWVHLRC